MGHVRNYTINDVMYRHLRMKGLQRPHADGLGRLRPGGKRAMKTESRRRKWTYDNIAYMKKQMQAMGLAIDWEPRDGGLRPGYYRWNQWLFLKDAGKGHRQAKPDRQLGPGGPDRARQRAGDRRSWLAYRRGGGKREIPMYYLKITDYAEELLDHADQIARLARAGAPDAGELDRQERGRRFAFPTTSAAPTALPSGRTHVGLHHARRHHHGRHLLRGGAAKHPLASTPRGARNPAGRLHRGMQTRRHHRETELALKEKKVSPTGLFVSIRSPATRSRSGSATMC